MVVLLARWRTSITACHDSSIPPSQLARATRRFARLEGRGNLTTVFSGIEIVPSIYRVAHRTRWIVGGSFYRVYSKSLPRRTRTRTRTRAQYLSATIRDKSRVNL